jgi:hypothetical protein
MEKNALFKLSYGLYVLGVMMVISLMAVLLIQPYSSQVILIVLQ